MPSYLMGRYQSVMIGESQSARVKLGYGVPQGSVLGPLLFTMYTAPLAKLLQKAGVMYHSYADDTQIYLAFKPGCTVSEASVRSKLESTLSIINEWLSQNMLKLKQDKTEVVVIATKANLLKNHVSSLSLGHICLRTKPQDSVLSMEHHVASICKSAYMHLYNIGRIRHCINQKTAEILVHALITSKLDYCNSVLFGISEKLLRRLQLVQNSAARIVTKSNKRDHITPILKNLHWLPVRFRIQYKALLILYKILNGPAPVYLKEIVEYYKPKRQLCSENKLLLDVPPTRLKTFGDRAFSVFAPRLWNALPLHVKISSDVNIFKSTLKTHFFNLCYNVNFY